MQGIAKGSEKQSASRRDNIIKFMYEFQSDNMYTPCIREIAAAANIPSTSVTNYYLDQLMKSGLVIRESRISRGARLSPDGIKAARILLGKSSLLTCNHCGAPVDDQGTYKPPESKKDKKIIRAVIQGNTIVAGRKVHDLSVAG